VRLLFGGRLLDAVRSALLILPPYSSGMAALDVVGTNTVIIATFGSIGGARGTEKQSNASCLFTGGGFTPTTIEPFDEPFTAPVFVVRGSAA
jgi:hypothetical protein